MQDAVQISHTPSGWLRWFAWATGWFRCTVARLQATPPGLQCNATHATQCNDATKRLLPRPPLAGAPWLGWLSIPWPKQAAGRSPIYADRPGSPAVLRGTALAQSTGVCCPPSSTWIALRAHTQMLLLTRPPVQESTAIVAGPLGGSWRRAPEGRLSRLTRPSPCRTGPRRRTGGATSRTSGSSSPTTSGNLSLYFTGFGGLRCFARKR